MANAEQIKRLHRRSLATLRRQIHGCRWGYFATPSPRWRAHKGAGKFAASYQTSYAPFVPS
jgi:hypothetical protein